jgi:hypothetical protein
MCALPPLLLLLSPGAWQLTGRAWAPCGKPWQPLEGRHSLEPSSWPRGGGRPGQWELGSATALHERGWDCFHSLTQLPMRPKGLRKRKNVALIYKDVPAIFQQAGMLPCTSTNSNPHLSRGQSSQDHEACERCPVCHV